MVCSVPGKGLRAFFCEIAGAQAMLYADDSAWPDTGLTVEPGWWRKPMQDFVEQVRFHCHRCGVPLRRFGQLAINGEYEEVSPVHAGIYKPKDKNRRVELVTLESGPARTLARVIDYIENGSGEQSEPATRTVLWRSIARRTLPTRLYDWLRTQRQNWHHRPPVR